MSRSKRHRESRRVTKTRKARYARMRTEDRARRRDDSEWLAAVFPNGVRTGWGL